MAYELKDGFGNAFKNKHKTEPKHPEYRGEIKTPSGDHLDISLWLKDGDKGKYFSISVQPHYVKPNSDAKPSIEQVQSGDPEPDSDLPF